MRAWLRSLPNGAYCPREALRLFREQLPCVQAPAMLELRPKEFYRLVAEEAPEGSNVALRPLAYVPHAE